MNNKKYAFAQVSILGAVEENCIKFIGDNSDATDEVLITKFKDMWNTSKGSTFHAQILNRTQDKIIIQSSKFNKRTNEYNDHMIWVFINVGISKYDWTLNRYRV